MFEKKSIQFEMKNIDETGVFEGYASVFGNKDAHGDVIEPGAFKKTLQERANRVKVCWQHDPNKPIGKVLEMKEDGKGLYVKAKISETTQGKDVLTLLKDGVITELSIGYDVIKEKWDNGIRRLKEIRLWEISPVTWGANELAMITNIKSKENNEIIERIEKIEETLESLQKTLPGNEKSETLLNSTEVVEDTEQIKKLLEILKKEDV